MIGSKRRRLDAYGPGGQAQAHLDFFFLRRSTTCHPTFFFNKNEMDDSTSIVTNNT
jgi:hypothetical protein